MCVFCPLPFSFKTKKLAGCKTGVYGGLYYYHISAKKKNIDCGYSIEQPHFCYFPRKISIGISCRLSPYGIFVIVPKINRVWHFMQSVS